MVYTELIESIDQFYADYYHDEINHLAARYPNEQRSLHIDWRDIYRYNPDLADDFIFQPAELQRFAEEALRLYDHQHNVSLGQAHARVYNLPETESFEIRELRARHTNKLIQLRGTVTEITDVNAKIEDAAFECQMCGTLTRIPQSSSNLKEPNKCEGCENQGPFRIDTNQSEFIDSQKLVIEDEPTASPHPPGTIEGHLEDDLTGEHVAGDFVDVTGVLRLIDETSSSTLESYLEVMSIKPVDYSEREYWPTSTEYTDDDQFREGLEEFVERSRCVLQSHEYLDENSAKAKIITPFIQLLGWNIYSTDVLMEYPREDTDITDRVDYALIADGDLQACVEAKRPSVNLDSKIGQLKRYMRLHRCDWGLLTNGERFIILRDHDEFELEDIVREVDCELEHLIRRESALSPLRR